MKIKINHAEAIITKLGGGYYWELEWIGVEEGFRGQGHGRSIIQKVIKAAWAKNAGALVAYLEPKSGGLTYDEEKAWFQRLGFKSDWFEFEGGYPKRVMILERK